MVTFLQDVLTDLSNNDVNFSELTFILPSKRAGIFLKKELAAISNNTIFSPSIASIEEFVQELSQLRQLSNTELLFELYTVYLNLHTESEKDTFDVFYNWGQLLLQDFNEIDRYLIPPDKLFNYLSAAKRLETWAIDENDDFIKSYLKRFEHLHKYYKNFKQELLRKESGYQGLIYREAVENLQNYIQSNPSTKHIFLGFNALNKAESNIIQELLHCNLADVYWDVDKAFTDDPIHDAGLFFRQHKMNWKYLKTHPVKWLGENYTKEKNIIAISTPKNVGQAKYVGELLSRLDTYENTAVVLSNENLLTPIINSIPKQVNALNITMGFPLRSTPMASLFDLLFLVHKDGGNKYYYKDVIALLTHKYIHPLFQEGTRNIVNIIQNNNYIYISSSEICSFDEQNEIPLKLIFKAWNSPMCSLEQCSRLIYEIKRNLDQSKSQSALDLEYLYHFNEIFNTLVRLNAQYKYIDSVRTLYGLFKELLASESLDFKGEPLQGLQIMGMLESRVLDFETVIITSVNEGILPAGKSNSSFIPYDIKKEYGLPTYKEKDAVYCYHFYRLIQRAKNIYLIYNSETDALKGGEKSRFITQLEIDKTHKVSHIVVAPENPSIQDKTIIIDKNETVISKLKDVAKKGFSPSSLTSYIRNPIDFYYRKVLDVKELSNVEEIVAANTLGTIIHNTLEEFYKPIQGEYLSEEVLNEMKSSISKTVKNHFKLIYKKGDIDYGKNLIIYEVAKRYVDNFITSEILSLKKGHRIKILNIELESRIKIEIPEFNFPINLTGKVDRVDEFDGVVRIIDYKTGKVEQPQLEIINWEDINSDYSKFSKSFQVLTYAYMLQYNSPFNKEVEAGIFSFKNQRSGFLKFSKKDKVGRGATKTSKITPEILNEFSIQLKKLISEILDVNSAFVEKPI